MPNPRPLRIRRSRRLALAASAALLLALALLSAALPPRTAQALPYPGEGGIHKAPVLGVSKSSVVVNEGQTATNSGSFDDSIDSDYDTVRVSASVGTIIQSGTREEEGTWSWSYATTNVPDDTTTQVRITARDSTGRSTSKYFSLKVLDLDPYPVNDMFANASPIDLAASLYGERFGNNRLATMETGEPDHRYSSTGQDCGMYGRKNAVWFKVTTPPNWPSEAKAITFRTTYGTNFDTVLALYRGTSLGTLQQVACSNNNPLRSSGNWGDALVISPPGTLSTGSTYYLQLSGTGGGAPSGKYRLAYEICPYSVGSDSDGICIG